jgi:hypothetical protein
MKNPLTALAESLLHSTTTATGQSTLPDWLVTPLAMAAGQDTAASKEPGWVDENMVRKAIAIYRAASARSAGPAAMGWQFSPDGRQAIQVLPAPTDTLQQQAFTEFSRRIGSVTMNHPRLAPVLDAAMRQGYPFLAARIGASFQSLTRRFELPLPPQRALQIGEQAVSALEYAHYRDIFHGAFDLHDILVNEQGQISLLGVGVEQLRQRLGPPGVALITPLLPPEIEAGTQTPDKRTDVFAMGALLYILLTNRVPAAGQQITLSQTLPDVPAAVDAVLTKALAADPNDRYPSLVEMNRDLRVALRARRTVARPSTPAQRSVAPAPARRHATSALSPNDETQPARPGSATPDGFPEPVVIPVIDISVLDLMHEMPQVTLPAALEFPLTSEIPKIDWTEMLRPVDLSELGGDPSSDLAYSYAETLAPDPLVAAAMAVTATEQAQQNRQRQMRRPAASAQPASQPATPPPSPRQTPAKPRRARRR